MSSTSVRPRPTLNSAAIARLQRRITIASRPRSSST